MEINNEDISFWQDAVKDVAPSEKKNMVAVRNTQTRIQIKEHRQYAVKHDFTVYSKALEDLEFGGIDKATLKKFKKEEFKIEAVLDLHGMTEDVAFAAVDDFIPRCYNEGKRCVVIITGKGLSVHNDGDIFAVRGVLKQRVPQWLNMSRLRAMILVYKHPSERLGGSGALYILLCRNKSL